MSRRRRCPAEMSAGERFGSNWNKESEMKTTDKVARAKELSKAAFEAGKPAAPIRDDAIMGIVGTGVPSDDHIAMLEGWAYGWHRANVGALIDTALAE